VGYILGEIPSTLGSSEEAPMAWIGELEEHLGECRKL
jgi:hypothetical protein